MYRIIASTGSNVKFHLGVTTAPTPNKSSLISLVGGWHPFDNTEPAFLARILDNQQVIQNYGDELMIHFKREQLDVALPAIARWIISEERKDKPGMTFSNIIVEHSDTNGDWSACQKHTEQLKKTLETAKKHR